MANRIAYNIVESGKLLLNNDDDRLVLEASAEAWTPPQEGLVRHWVMSSDSWVSNECIDEVSGRTTTQYPSNLQTYATDNNGVASGATSFDGLFKCQSSGYTGLPIGASARSACIWIKGTGLENADGVFGYGTNSTRQAWGMDYETGAGEGIRAAFYADVTLTNFFPTGGTWYWLYMEYTGTVNNVYYNGNHLVATETLTLNTGTALDLTFGSTAYSNNYINADMCNFMVYNRVLTSAERTDIYENQ